MKGRKWYRHLWMIPPVVAALSANATGFPRFTEPGCGGNSATRVGSVIAQSEPGGVRVLWYTLSEINSVSFDLNRSSSPTGPFSLVAQIAAVGQDSGAVYEVFDSQGSTGDYYRLFETDGNGGFGPCAPLVRPDEQPALLTPIGLQVAPGQNPNYLGTASAGPPYDALIVCPDAWVTSLSALRDHWAQFRHHAAMLTAFSQTGTTKEQIRSYILSLTTVKYVLLVGDTENQIEPGNVIPTWYVQDYEPWEQEWNELATDAPYGDLDGDGLADLALGRWPAHSSADVTLLVNKSVAYDHQNPSQSWRQRWTGFTSISTRSIFG